MKKGIEKGLLQEIKKKLLSENAKLKQINYILKFELKEIIKAVQRYRREYATPTYVKEFGRKVTLDFDDPLYPYCPFRLKDKELELFIKNSQK